MFGGVPDSLAFLFAFVFAVGVAGAGEGAMLSVLRIENVGKDIRVGRRMSYLLISNYRIHCRNRFAVWVVLCVGGA